MKFLNFIPLLLWMLGFLALWCVQGYFRETRKQQPLTDNAVLGGIYLYIAGIILFLLIGSVLSR